MTLVLFSILKISHNSQSIFMGLYIILIVFSFYGLIKNKIAKTEEDRIKDGCLKK
jgi:hypothetical protein